MLIGKSTGTPPEKCIHPVGRLLEVVIEVLERLLRIAVLAGLQKRHCRIVGLFLFCRYLNGLTVNHHNLRFEYGKALVERYAVQVDPQLHREVRDRYYALGIEPYGGFVNPEFELVEKDGRVVDVKISYPANYVEQMLGYSKNYSFLPNIN